MPPNLNEHAPLKALAAQAALDHIQDTLNESTVLGIGTGSTANYFIDLLADRRVPLKGTVASSSASSKRLQAHGIPVLDLNEIQAFDFYIDGADEITSSLAMIKGGGAALTQEKIVAAVAQTFICVADESKWVDQLGQFPLPVEVIPMARNYVARQLSQLGGRPVYREGVITDNGCNILDVHDLHISSPIATEAQINQITGVVTNGLFAARSADLLLLSTKSDGVKSFQPENRM